MAALYSVEESDEEPSLREKMNNAVREDGTKVYMLPTALSLMVFYMLAMQCMGTLAVVKCETRSWKWPAIQFIYMPVLAYGMSWVVYHLFLRIIHKFLETNLFLTGKLVFYIS